METLKSVTPSYRADIDGLRGIAVLSVVSYHYLGGICPGGFVGVDIFFVISGYLLSEIIISESKAGCFSFSRFYERRIRRIFPALFFLLTCSTIFAWLFLLPPDLVSYSRSVTAASLSVSNFYFWKTSNYFDAPAAVKPLLHTWSLAVEEQFYLLFPIFVVLVQRYLRKYFSVVIVVVALASFGWSVIEVRLDPGAAFFLPFTRAWELLTGTLLAIRILPFSSSRLWRECIAAAGGLGMAFAMFEFTQNTPFPGAYALLPCLSAAAIIVAGQQGPTMAGSLLSQKPIVFVGLISYSLYLWHWPLLVFSKIAMFGLYDLPILSTHLLLLLASIVIAAFSWKFIETPFRRGSMRPKKKTIFQFGAGCVAISTASALLILAAHGVNRRFPAKANEIAEYIDYGVSHRAEQNALFRSGSCYLDRREAISDFDEQVCLAPMAGKRQVLVFGDSHAANLQYGLEAGVPSVHFLQATSSSCPPTLSQNAGATAECREFVKQVLNRFIPNRSIKTVVLNADWNDSQLENLSKTIDLLRQQKVEVIVLGPVPTYDQALPRLLAKSLINGNRNDVVLHLNSHLETLDREMGRLAEEKWHVPYISLMEILCPGRKCMEYAAPEVPLEFDQGHLTLQGSEYVGHAIGSRFGTLFH